MAKEIKFSEEARKSLEIGVNKLAEMLYLEEASVRPLLQMTVLQ